MESTALRREAQTQTQTYSRTTPKTDLSSEIQSNPVYAILMAQGSPEEKKAALAEFLSVADKERVAAYQTFEAYTQSVREAMANEIIKLTDTETFSELKSTYDDLNSALLDFDNKMKPLTEIIDAVYKLRQSGKTLSAFQEIISDREAEKKRAAELTAITNEFDSIRQRLTFLNSEIDSLKRDKLFFGWFGPLSDQTKRSISRDEREVTQFQDRLKFLEDRTRELEASGDNPSELGDLVAEKARLRELLDISSDVHKERQKALVQAALDFVSLTKTRTGSISSHLGAMDSQLNNLLDANGRMTGIFAVMSEAVVEAEKKNQEARESLGESVEGESLISKMTRDESRMKIENHIKSLEMAGANTTQTYADLTSQRVRVQTMCDANQNQRDRVRAMHTQGVAGVADRLSVVLQAVSGAALGESSAMANETLSRMATSTSEIAQKESLRVAMGIQELNQDVLKAIDDLGTYGEVVRTSTEITKKGLSEMQENLARIKDLASGVQSDIREAVAVTADVLAKKPERIKEISPSSSTFGFGAH